MRRSAFSLLEALLVLTIISVLSAIALPRYSQFTAQQQLDAATRRVLLDLESTKRRAQLTSSNRQIVFYPAAERYTQVGLADMDHPGQSATVRLDEEPYAAALVSALFGGDSTLIFDGYGTPDTGGTIVISVGSLQSTISIDGPTGKIIKLQPLIE